jgi:hypothetical protein
MAAAGDGIGQIVQPAAGGAGTGFSLVEGFGLFEGLGGIDFLAGFGFEVGRDGLNGSAMLASTDAAGEGVVDCQHGFAMGAGEPDHGCQR